MAITNTNINTDFITAALNDAIKKKAHEIADEVAEKAHEDFLEKLAKAMPEIMLKVQSYFVIKENLQGVSIEVRMNNGYTTPD
jgi:hypothetical protein